MSYTVTDHGTWMPYTPDPLPDWARPIAALGGIPAFLRRTGDGTDFYAFRKGEPFAAHPVVATTLLDPATQVETVKTVFRDTSMVFPINQRLIAIDGVDPEADPLALLAEKVYDPVKRSFSDPLPPPVPSVQAYQFAGQAAAEGIISDDDATAWVASGRIPQKLIDAVKASVTDPDRQKRVLLFLVGTTVFPRSHELTPVLAAQFGKDTPAKIDGFFAAASKR